jgi:putative flippase GtrA
VTAAQSLRALLRSRILRFGAVGAAGFLVDEGVLTLLHSGLGAGAYAARIVSIFCAMTFTWWGNRTLTFAEHAAEGAAETAREWFKFVLANSIGAVVNFASFSLLVRFASFPLSNPQVATAIGVGIGLIFNFTLSKHFVFRTR